MKIMGSLTTNFALLMTYRKMLRLFATFFKKQRTGLV